MKNLSDYELCASAIRMLSVDAVEQAQSGHPGMPMGMADIASVLWLDFFKHAPSDPRWLNRDRFVVSNGHGSMLLYALLYLSGYDLSIEEIKAFRQLGSKTPGHPEYGLTPGVETTTGPLGQGLANAVGMAIGERTLGAQFNQASHCLIDHFTYVFVGDGCLMEGISHEVSSLAGTLGLGKLIVFWDDNGISIDGGVSNWCKDDVPKRFRAYGWDVIEGLDGHDPQAIHQAILEARSDLSRPTLIACKTMIGYGSPNMAGSEKTHGAPLGQTEIAAIRKALQWPYPPFEIPDEIMTLWDANITGQKHLKDWGVNWQAYQQQFPELASELQRRLQSELPQAFRNKVQNQLKNLCHKSSKGMATRKASAQFLAQWANDLPELLGGSADLTCSNLTSWPDMKPIHQTVSGQYLYYGVREFGMFAIMNGLALYGGFVPFGGTFLTFVDYGRNALRMAALMQIKTIFVLTHDSIGLGEDGPTHQPIEHLTMLRATPNVYVWRPCDLFETHIAWLMSLTYQGPSCLALSRQSLPEMNHDETHISGVERGGYICYEPKQRGDDKLDGLIIATGSEVFLAVNVAQKMMESGHNIRVVSMPCVEMFAIQDKAYHEHVLPASVTQRLAVEAGATSSWWRWVGGSGRILGLDSFGESAPASELFRHVGITEEAIVSEMEAVLSLGNKVTE